MLVVAFVIYFSDNCKGVTGKVRMISIERGRSPRVSKSLSSDLANSHFEWENKDSCGFPRTVN